MGPKGLQRAIRFSLSEGFTAYFDRHQDRRWEVQVPTSFCSALGPALEQGLVSADPLLENGFPC